MKFKRENFILAHSSRVSSVHLGEGGNSNRSTKQPAGHITSSQEAGANGILSSHSPLNDLQDVSPYNWCSLTLSMVLPTSSKVIQ